MDFPQVFACHISFDILRHYFNSFGNLRVFYIKLYQLNTYLSIFQHDNATSHTARSVRDFLQDRNVIVLPWPAKSLDLNPVDHAWDLVDRQVRARAIPRQKYLGSCRRLGGRVG